MLCNNMFYGNLRAKCFVIGYLNLVACLVDIVFHVLIAAIVSNGFQCDVDRDSLQLVDWPWLEPLLLFVNLGTHGFYPLPLILKSNNIHVKYMPIPLEPKCYPGMVHIYLIDVLNFLINIIWLKFVVSYIFALHKKDPEPMRMFFGLSVVKLGLQVMYFAYQPNFLSAFPMESYWMICLTDLMSAALFLMLVNRYTAALNREKAMQHAEQPPAYIECMMGSSPLLFQKKEDIAIAHIAILEDNKVDTPAILKPQEV